MFENLQDVKEYLMEEGAEEAEVFENPDYAKAVIGLSDDNRVIYDFDLMIESLMEEDNMSYDDAVEFIEYNTIRSLPYEPADTRPIILTRIPDYYE